MNKKQPTHGTEKKVYIITFERVPPYPQHARKEVIGLYAAWQLADKLAGMPQVKAMPKVYDFFGNQVMRNGKLV